MVSSSRQNFLRAACLYFLSELNICYYLQRLRLAQLLNRRRIIEVHSVICVVVSCNSSCVWDSGLDLRTQADILCKDLKMTTADLGVTVRHRVSMGAGVCPPHRSLSVSWKTSVFLCNVPTLLPRQPFSFPLQGLLGGIPHLENDQQVFSVLKELLRGCQ